jgi:hypothetical protein
MSSLGKPGLVFQGCCSFLSSAWHGPAAFEVLMGLLNRLLSSFVKVESASR